MRVVAGRNSLAVAVALVALLICSGIAAASTGEKRGDLSDQLFYQETDTSVEASSSSFSGCFDPNDHQNNAGGGVLLPFSYRPAQLFNAGPGGSLWNFFLTGKGAGNPTPVTLFQICADFPTKYHSAKFSVPADGKAHSKIVSCGKGQKALSGGLINYPGSVGQDTSRAITESYPVDGPDKGHGRGDACRVTSRASKSYSKRAEGAVICVKDPAVAVRYRRFGFVSHKKSFDGVYVDCKPSEQVTGGGPQLAKQKQGLRLTTSAPFDTGADDDTTPSNRWATGLDGPNKGRVAVTAWGVCISVS